MTAAVTAVAAVRVRRADGRTDYVAAVSAACRSCGQCGAAAMSPASIETADSRAGQLALPSRSLLLICAATYGVPLAGLLGGALVAAVLRAGDVATVALALTGLVCAMALTRSPARSLEQRTERQLTFLESSPRHNGQQLRQNAPGGHSVDHA